MSIDQYSQTPASNDLANYFQTGMAPSKVKNAGWDIMADLAQQIASLPTSGGSANAQTVTNTRQIGALFTGLRARFVPGFTNTGAMTFAPDGLTAKNVFANGAAALAGQVVSGVPADMVYDGTQWNLLNPSPISGSVTGTPTGFSGSPGTCTISYRVTADGQLVTLQFGPGISGTSNATTFTITGLPSSLAPTLSQAFYTSAQDGGSAIVATLIMTASSSTITLGKSGGTIGSGASSWTASGTKAFANSAASSVTPTITYVRT